MEKVRDSLHRLSPTNTWQLDTRQPKSTPDNQDQHPTTKLNTGQPRSTLDHQDNTDNQDQHPTTKINTRQPRSTPDSQDQHLTTKINTQQPRSTPDNQDQHPTIHSQQLQKENTERPDWKQLPLLLRSKPTVLLREAKVKIDASSITSLSNI